MGQALRRATGRRVQASVNRSPSVESSAKSDLERRLPSAVPNKTEEVSPVISGQDNAAINTDQDNILKMTKEGAVLEERDPGFDAMLNKMVGRITTKPGGKLEMGEAFIVEKYKRPLPKVRSSKADTDFDVKKSTPSGTLTALQLQEIILLHQGKSNSHQGPMSVHDVAERFRIDVAQVKSIVQFISMPPENNSDMKKDEV